MTDLKRTALYDFHQEFGAKMVPFAGYALPVQYKLGVMKEHLHCRASAGLFDVSHMGQIILRAKSGSVRDAALALEALVPVNVAGLAEGRQRYGMFTNAAGGILDDLMISNKGDHLLLVVNAACKAADFAHLQANLSDRCDVTLLDDRALIALQGPRAEQSLAALNPAVRDMKFMDVADVKLAGVTCWVSRSGYTGEDGFEISVPNQMAETLARQIWETGGVEPIGLGARDSLRLEAGMCLYGHDIDETTTPVEAALEWAIQKVRRAGGERAGGFPGADRIFEQIENGASRRRVGLLPEGRAPMREGTLLFSDENAAEPAGHVTSGAFGPSLNAPVSMGYVPTPMASPGTRLWGEVRGKRMAANVAAMPFHPNNYKR